MPNLTQQLLPELSKFRLPNIELAEDLVFPNYPDQSILNIPASICQLLNIPTFGSPPLKEEILGSLAGDYKNVILILMDALALHRFQSWMQEYRLTVWEKLIETGILAPLTSITPSTTSAAITTLWTGKPTAWHGITGYETWLKEYGVISNMILHQPSSYQSDIGSLQQAGFSPDTFLPKKETEANTFGTHLASHNIKAHAFQHAAIANSGMSRMFLTDTLVQPFKTISEMWTNISQLIQTDTNDRKYIWAYWDAVDSFSHHYGPDHEIPAIEFSEFSAAFEQLFLNKLEHKHRQNTLLILTADHGQITTTKDPHYNINNHPNLLRRLHMNPTGENRLAYLYIRPGQTEAVREYIDRTWPNQFILIESDYALHNGLFGPGEVNPNTNDRIGDLIMVAKGAAYLWWGLREDPLIGRHGGLSSQEMIVPFLASSLS